MKKKYFIIITFILLAIFTLDATEAFAQLLIPKPCQGSGCPVTPKGLNYKCASSYENWLKNPRLNFWVEDEEVTRLGKNAERARQFLYWVLTRAPVYYHNSIIKAWNTTRNFALVLVLLTATLAGLEIIIIRK